MSIVIQIQDLGLSFPQKICFEGFSNQIHDENRIAIIGQNGCGKSTLLKILQKKFEPSCGSVKILSGATIGYVPQIIEEFESLSGGQRFNETLTKALSLNPDILLLDEPTNHLDHHNKKSLMRMLRQYRGILITASHDVEFLKNCADTLWHIDNGRISVFKGSYDDYVREIQINRSSLEHELSQLECQKREAHNALMKEQERAKKSGSKGRKSIQERKWPTIVSTAKANRAGETLGKKQKAIRGKREQLTEQLSDLRIPEIITPKFSIQAAEIRDRALLTIIDGSASYQENSVVIEGINLSMRPLDKIAIRGNNGSGKSTLIKAILNDSRVTRKGDWLAPKNIGYLDQHYCTLSPNKSVLETIEELVLNWEHAQVRRHLNDFLFRKNEEVHAKTETLSGGEKFRLSLAQIAAKTQKLLILDEITNNVDLTCKEHLLKFLRNYPGGFIIVCHDEDFLKNLQLDAIYLIEEQTLKLL